jgi:hypothetical protein
MKKPAGRHRLYISPPALLLPASFDTGPRALGGCKECHLKDIHIAQNSGLPSLETKAVFACDSDARFTPARFIKEAGTVIAVCLGLGLLAQLLAG